MAKRAPSTPIIPTPAIPDSWKLSEKTIELTACAQFGQFLERVDPGKRIVWFGLTQKEERRYGFDASTQIGGLALILQFKVSRTVLQSGPYAGHRKFWCQHQQMRELRRRFGNISNQCFYFLPDLGTFDELNSERGDVLGNSFLLDVADLPRRIPQCRRVNGYHYAYVDAVGLTATVASDPFTVKLIRADRLLKKALDELQSTAALVKKAKLLEREQSGFADVFFRNAALAVIV